MPPFNYINGYPGVGKLTIAKELNKLLPRAKVVSNHLLIDPAAALFDRTAQENQPLRPVLRREVLRSIASSVSTRDITWIFTDQQSSNQSGSSSAKDYQDAATARGAPFVSVILHCELEENLKRAVQGEKGGCSNTKLTNPTILRSIREREDIFRFKDENELELDVTLSSPREAARRIYDHLSKMFQLDDAGQEPLEHASC
ncbi:AAA domain-containing protein [Hirsutella rhossiliensis]